MHIAIVILTLSLALVVGWAQSEPLKSKPDVGNGRVAWFDIATSDLARAKEFYGGLFGWKFIAVKGTDQAAEIVAGGTSIGTIRVGGGSLSAHNGVVYIQVADLPASCKKATELGGTLVPGFPFDLPDDRGSIGLLTDPAGHPMGMYSKKPLPSQKPAGK
jgi:predicted enzyme related to lactoylglutathione lyase